MISTFGVDIKIVDATTGEIRRAEAIEASVQAGQGVATGNFRTAEAADARDLQSLRRRLGPSAGRIKNRHPYTGRLHKFVSKRI